MNGVISGKLDSLERLGDFELIRELGRGGMGVVYEARQVSLNRKVALKVLKAGLGLTTQAVMRFRREAASAARLHHTNIVPIYAIGEQQEHHFYAMELIAGPSLDKVIERLPKERGQQAPAEMAKPRATSSSPCFGWLTVTGRARGSVLLKPWRQARPASLGTTGAGRFWSGWRKTPPGRGGSPTERLPLP